MRWCLFNPEEIMTYASEALEYKKYSILLSRTLLLIFARNKVPKQKSYLIILRVVKAAQQSEVPHKSGQVLWYGPVFCLNIFFSIFSYLIAFLVVEICVQTITLRWL